MYSGKSNVKTQNCVNRLKTFSPSPYQTISLPHSSLPCLAFAHLQSPNLPCLALALSRLCFCSSAGSAAGRWPGLARWRVLHRLLLCSVLVRTLQSLHAPQYRTAGSWDRKQLTHSSLTLNTHSLVNYEHRLTRLSGPEVKSEDERGRQQKERYRILGVFSG